MPKIVNHEQYRNELLEKSFDCFTSNGYSGLTMRDLAKHLGVSTGTLYHYFPSKVAIFEQLVEFQADQDLILASSISKSKSLKRDITAILTLMVDHRDYLLKQTSLWLEFGRQSGFVELLENAVIARSYERYRVWLGQFLQSDDDALITFVCSYMSGLVMDMNFHPGQFSIADQSAILVGAISSRRKLSGG